VFLLDEAHTLLMDSKECDIVGPSTGAVIMKLNEEHENIERILESAVVVNWEDLMGGGQGGLINIEYGFAPGGRLDYVQVWSSVKRGYWLLACTYWMSASQSHQPGVSFDNGFESEGLAHILEVVMQHQNVFGLSQNLGPQGVLRVGTPTEKESKAAAVSINDAFNRVNSLSKSHVPRESDLALRTA
jgi:hypothetical protein